MERDKAEWRRRAKQARAALSIDHDRHCQVLAEFLAIHPGTVLIYDAMDGEVDVGSLTERPGLGPFAVTRTPEIGSTLTIHPHGGPVERHRYGFEQPVADAPIIEDGDIAVVLVPGLAFDRLGNRLGRGRGYYDRLLARLAKLGEGAGRPKMVGMTAGYVVAELPTDAYDVAMTHLCGEFGVLPVPLAEPEG